MPLILGTNSIKDTGYNVANSCRFNDGDSAYMHKTPGSAGNRRKFTFSCWIKKGDIAPGDDTCLFSGNNSDDETRPDDIRIRTTGKLYVSFRNTNDGIVSTQRVLRDPSAWMNIVVAVDTEQGTAANRVKIYINGVQESNLEGDGSGSPTYPSEDHDCTGFGRDTKITVGARARNTPDKFFDGYMAEVCYIDGSQLAATSFGEFDEDSPTIWKPIDVSGLTFGTNGFYLDFEDSSNLGNDKNGGTDLTEVNLAATDQATDTPTNNFATLNPLIDKGITYSEGNVHYKNTHGSNSEYTHPTIQNVSNGRWYYEIRMGSANNDSAYEYFGSPTAYVKTDDNIHPSGTTTVSSGDIFGFYLNYEDGQITIHRNGSEIYQSSSGISLSTTTAQIAAFNNTEYQANFGNPSYSISSGNADANGYGNFEYSPVLSSVNFYSLCTKNLAEYG